MGSPNTAGAKITLAGAPVVVGFFPDISDILDFLDGPSKRPSKAATELEAFLFELASIKSSMGIAGGGGRAGLVLRIILIGEKLVKIVIGTSEADSGNSYLFPLDDLRDDDNQTNFSAFSEFVNRLQTIGTKAGFSVMEPTYIGDP
jgi:hypothetical protein